MLKFTVTEKSRLDKFIASQVDVSRSRVQRAIKGGQVLVNNQPVIETDYSLMLEDIVTLPEFEQEKLKPFDLDLKIVFENDDCLVLDKPAGLVVHPGAGNMENTLAHALVAKYPQIEKVGDPHRPGIVHRLDEGTSGLILVAKNQDSFEYFKDLFQTRRIEKEYITLVHGAVEKKHEVIDLPLEKVPLKQKMKVGTGKPAVTEYFVRASGEIPGLDQVTLLRVKLHTGRTHQIRAHLAHIGHPVVGDGVYGSSFKSQDSELINHQFLHAYKLKFQLKDNTWIELASELPEDLKQVLQKANINYDYKF